MRLQTGSVFLPHSDQHEIDLVLDFGNSRWAVEIKLTANPAPQDMERLSRIADLIDADRRFLVSQVRDTVETERRISCNLPWLLEHIEKKFA